MFADARLISEKICIEFARQKIFYFFRKNFSKGY